MIDDTWTDLELPFHGVRLPEFSLDKEDQKKLAVKENASSLEILTALCREGYKTKIANNPNKVKNSETYIKQVKHELEILDETKFVEYIILVWDVINFCNRKDIPVGIGRGSAASSLVNYLIGITGIDPIEWNLYFERFVSKSRAKSTIVDGALYYDGSLLPDIDLDIGHERRGEVVEYLKSKHVGKCSKVCTISTLQTKILIKEVGKIVGGYSEEYMNVITDSIPVVFGKVRTIDQAAEESPRFKEFVDKNPLIIEISKKLHDGPKARGVHASAYLLSYDTLDKFIPTQLDADNELCSSFDMHTVNNLALKLDLLGLKCVTIIDKVCKKVGIKMQDIKTDSYDDIYKYLQNLETPYGLFQISGDAVVKSLCKMQPKTPFELSNVIAIARPGAMHFVDDYVNDIYPVDDAKITEILKPTHGVCIFQEQAIKIGKDVFGLTAEISENIRRVIGKKKVKEMPKYLEIIEKQAKKLNISKEVKDYYLQVLTDGANYQFAAAHSAPYSYLGALTVYLKFKYPKEFFLESIKCYGKEDIPAIERELPYFGIKLLRPDVIKSKEDFTIEGDNIRFGLAGIKGLNDSSLLKIGDFLNKETSNKFQVFNAAKQAKVSILVLANIIHAGALNSLGEDRLKLVLEAQIWNELNDKEKTYCLTHGMEYNFDLIKMLRQYTSWIDSSGKKFKESRLETLRRDTKDYFEKYKKNSQYAKLSAYLNEKKLLGYSYSTTIKDIFLHDNPDLLNCREVKDLVEKSPVQIVAEVSDVKKGRTKNSDKPYLKLSLMDESGEIQAMIMGERLERYSNKFKDPEEGNLIFGIGSAGKDIIWLNSLEVQNVE